MLSYQEMKSHCGEKMILQPSFLHIGISCTDKMTYLCWIGIGFQVIISQPWVDMQMGQLCHKKNIPSQQWKDRVVENAG